MRILSLDLGKYKSVACDYEAETGGDRFTTIPTNPQALHDLIVDREPDRVVIEICSIAGWVSDLVRALGIEIQVANPNDERWQWRKPSVAKAQPWAEISQRFQRYLIAAVTVSALQIQATPTCYRVVVLTSLDRSL
jgi:hypothetical protein